MNRTTKDKKKDHMFSLRVPEELRTEIQKIADRDEVTPAAIVRRALEYFIENDMFDRDVKLLIETPHIELPMLINAIKTDRGWDIYKSRLRRGE